MNDVAVQKEPKTDFRDIEISDTGAGGGLLMPKNFGEVIKFADVMARSSIAIPKHLRDNPGACMAVTMQALRWEMDPWMVASKTYFVNDRIAYEAQLVGAVVNTRAPIARTPDYEFTGEGASLKCRVSVEMQDGSVKIYESPLVGAITTKNSPLWKSDPQQQLGYYSIRAWARRYAPEVLLGIYTPDELTEDRQTMRDVTPATNRLAQKLASAAKPESGFNHEFVKSEIDGATIDAETGEVMEHQETGDESASAVASSQAAEATATSVEAASEGEGSAAEPSAADVDEWFAKGAEAFKAGASRRAVPPEIRNSPEGERWVAGFDSAKDKGSAQ